MLDLNRNEKVTCENCGTQTTEEKNVRHKKNVQLERGTALNVHTFRKLSKLTGLFTWSRSTAQPKQKESRSITPVFKTFPVYNPCDYTDEIH